MASRLADNGPELQPLHVISANYTSQNNRKSHEAYQPVAINQADSYSYN